MIILNNDPSLISPDKYNNKRMTINGIVYTQREATSSGDVYVANTPNKPIDSEIQFEGILPLDTLRRRSPELFYNLKSEDFNFTITPETINERLGKPRPCPQKKAYGATAKATFEEWGAELTAETQMHLMHRHGWSLGGAQSRENLDPGTAGSNYSTLLWIEAPIKKFVQKNNIKEVRIKGTVFFHPLMNQIPIKISYECTWGNNRQSIIHIYPLEPRKPTHTEHEVASTILSHIETPLPPKKEHVNGQNSLFKTIQRNLKSSLEEVKAGTKEEEQDSGPSIT
jgi:hypothetical protein